MRPAFPKWMKHKLSRLIPTLSRLLHELKAKKDIHQAVLQEVSSGRFGLNLAKPWFSFSRCFTLHGVLIQHRDGEICTAGLSWFSLHMYSSVCLCMWVCIVHVFAKKHSITLMSAPRVISWRSMLLKAGTLLLSQYLQQTDWTLVTAAYVNMSFKWRSRRHLAGLCRCPNTVTVRERTSLSLINTLMLCPSVLVCITTKIMCLTASDSSLLLFWITDMNLI